MGKIFDGLMPDYATSAARESPTSQCTTASIPSSTSPATGCPFPSRYQRRPHQERDGCHAATGRRPRTLGFINKTTLRHLNQHKVLILSNVNMMDDGEIETIRGWVRAGGNLLATGWTSLVDTRGRLRKDFGLGDVFGVSLQKPSWAPWPHYMAPRAEGEAAFGDFRGGTPAFAQDRPGSLSLYAQGLRRRCSRPRPWYGQLMIPRASSIHSNPAWRKTDQPEVVLNRFGAGSCIYCASPLEAVESLSGTIVRLVRRLHDRCHFEADAPSAVELTLFYQPDRHRYRLSLVNFQKDLPNIPVTDIPVRLRLPERVVQIVELPGGRRSGSRGRSS